MRSSKLVLSFGALTISGLVWAENGSIEFYGMLNGDLERVKASAPGASNIASRWRVSSNISHLGVRGSRDLGNGIKGIFQVESGLGLDTGTNTNSSGTTRLNFQGTIGSRNTNVGLTGSLGTVFLGHWDTPYKWSTFGVDPFGAITIAGYQAIVGGAGTNFGDNDNVARNVFDRNAHNSVQYWTPSVSGFSARFAYASDEERTSTRNPYLLSTAATYRNGAVLLTAAYERHVDVAGALGGNDKAAKLGGAYTFGSGTTLSGMVESIKYSGGFATGALTVKGNTFNSVATSSVKLNALHVGLLQKVGAHSFRFSYSADSGLKENGGKLPNSEAKKIAVGYAYDLAQATELFAFATKISNSSQSANTFGPNTLLGVAKGSDPEGFGVGLKYVF